MRAVELLVDPRQRADSVRASPRRGSRSSPLRHLADQAAVAGEELFARMALDVDEARGHDQAAGVDRPLALASAACRRRNGAIRSPRKPTSP